MFVVAFAVVVPVLAGLLVVRHVKAVRLPRGGAVAVVALIAAAGAAFIGFDVAHPGEPIATGVLAPPGSSGASSGIDLPAVEGREVVVVDGNFDPSATGAAAADYVIDVDSGGQKLPAIEGRLEQHLESRRVGRRGHAQVLVAHVERTHNLPAESMGKPLHLTLKSETGPIAGPLRVLVRAADPPMAAVFGTAGVLLLLMLVLLARQLRKQAFPPVFVVIAACFYAVLLENGAHPPSISGLFVIAVAAALLGAVVSAVVTVLPFFERGERIPSMASSE